jgi:hypothetical protein
MVPAELLRIAAKLKAEQARRSKASKSLAAAQQERAKPSQLAAMRRALDTTSKTRRVLAENRGVIEQAGKPFQAQSQRLRVPQPRRRRDRLLSCRGRPAGRPTASPSRDGPRGDDPHQPSEDDEPPRRAALVPRREWRDWAYRRARELARLFTLPR